MTGNNRSPFILEANQVPDPPESLYWSDLLRWSIAVMDHDDPDIAFAASLLSQTIERPGLTDKQARYAKRLVDRVSALWSARRLSCQSNEPGRLTREEDEEISLAVAQTRGNA